MDSSTEAMFYRVTSRLGIDTDTPLTEKINAYVDAHDRNDFEGTMVIHALITGQTVGRYIGMAEKQPLGAQAAQLMDETQARGVMEALVFLLEQLSIAGLHRTLEGPSEDNEEMAQGIMDAISLLVDGIVAYRTVIAPLPEIAERPQADTPVPSLSRLRSVRHDEREEYSA